MAPESEPAVAAEAMPSDRLTAFTRFCFGRAGETEYITNQTGKIDHRAEQHIWPGPGEALLRIVLEPVGGQTEFPHQLFGGDAEMGENRSTTSEATATLTSVRRMGLSIRSLSLPAPCRAGSGDSSVPR